MFEAAGQLEPMIVRSPMPSISGGARLGAELDGIITYDTRLADAARAHGIPVTPRAERRSCAETRVRACSQGRRFRLRPVRESDLDASDDAHTSIASRGAYFPLGVMSEPAFRRDFAEHGFWQQTEGMLLITDPDGEIAGHIEFFRPVTLLGRLRAVLPALRRPPCRPRLRHRGDPAARRLPVRGKKEHRIHLVIVPENAASRRIAEKCGFTLEGTVRGAFFNDGRNQDVLLYSLLSTDPRPWRPPDVSVPARVRSGFEAAAPTERRLREKALHG